MKITGMKGRRFPEQAYRAALVLLFFVYLLQLTVIPVEGNDTWWHLGTGEYIVKNRVLPREDVFSYTAAGNEWVNHEWLYDAALYGVYSAAGLNGLIFFNAFFLFAAFGLLMAAARVGKENFPAAVMLLLLVVLVASKRFIVRPHCVSYFFMALYLFLLYLFKYRGKNAIAAVPFIQMLWANTHGEFVAGLAILWLFLLGESLDTLVKKGALLNKKAVTLLAVSLAATAFSLINPYGPKMFLQSFQMTAGGGYSAFTSSIMEWMPPFDPLLKNFYSTFYYIIWIAVSVLLFPAALFGKDRTLLPLFVFFFALTFRSDRLVTSGAIASYPFLTYCATRAAGAAKLLRGGPLDRLRSVAGILLRAAAAAVLIFANADVFLHGNRITFDGTTQRTGLGGGNILPRRVADYILSNHVRGNMFNSYETGGYLIWRLYPDNRVFIDSRAQTVYGGDFQMEYMRAVNDAESLLRLIDKYRITFFVLDYRYVTLRDITNTGSIYNFFTRPEGKDWKLVCADDAALLYLKDAAENGPLVKRDAYRAINPVFFNMENITETNLSPASVGEYERLTTEDPASVKGHAILGVLYSELNRLDDAERELRAADLLSPGTPLILSKLGEVLVKKGDYVGAAGYFERSMAVDSARVDNYIYLGIICKNRGEYEKSADYLKKAIALNPALYEPYLNLGVTYLMMGDRRNADDMFEKAYRINPDAVGGYLKRMGQ